MTINTLGGVTGGGSTRDGAFCALDADHRIGYGTPGYSWIGTDALLGPLDAPDKIPAGSMNSTEWTTGRGDPSPHITEVAR